jgi:tetratricopeptide (TPR) repeat protein
MSNDRIFVGRRDELRRFQDEVLEKPDGQAVVVIGQPGMGKTYLVDKMAQSAAAHPNLTCGHIRYECTPNDTPDAVMALMMDQAYECAKLTERSFNATPHRLKQWKAFLDVFKVGDLVMSLRRDPQRPTREQFVKTLETISERMKQDQRAIFVVDPEKYMHDNSADEWRIVVRDLPPKIKFIFAQRPEDQLATRHEFLDLPNVVIIPKESLDVLDDQAVDDLIQARADQLPISMAEARSALARYHGHPYAVNAALNLLADGLPLDTLPNEPKPTAFARAQWQRVCNEHGEAAIKLLTAYAVLEVPVPDDLVESVAEVSPVERKQVLANPFLSSLLRSEADGRRIYHVLLIEQIMADPASDETRGYHQRAIAAYRSRLKRDGPPDVLAASRLPEHVLRVDGLQAFVECFLDEATPSLATAGAFDTLIALTEKALNEVPDDSTKQSALYGNLGPIYQTRGELDRAEEVCKKSLEIDAKLGRQEGMAVNYGNLGLLYKNRGELDRAEEMLKKSLQIDTKLGHQEGMAKQYGNLGLTYRNRGNLDRAEKMFKKSLKINAKLGRQEGMANQYGNLGLIYIDRGELDRAEEMFKKSLEIDTQLGRPEGMAIQYGNVGVIYLLRGELDRAEEMLKKSLEISTKLGHLEGMANQYGNLGAVCGQRGDLRGARELGTKARDLYAQIGMPHKVQQFQGWLDQLPPQ